MTEDQIQERMDRNMYLTNRLHLERDLLGIDEDDQLENLGDFDVLVGQYHHEEFDLMDLSLIEEFEQAILDGLYKPEVLTDR